MPTVDDLRNAIRLAVDRYERVESTALTKEALAAVCAAVGDPVEATGRLPPKPEMRARILRTIDHAPDADPTDCERAFRKAELEAIAAALGAEP